MRAFAAAAGAAQTGRKLVLGEDGEPLRVPSALDAWRPVYAEAMVRVLCDCGLRRAKLLPIERDDLKLGPCAVPQCPAHLHLRRTAHEGVTQDGTKTTHGARGHGGGAVGANPAGVGRDAARAAAADRHAARVPAPEGRLFRERNLWHPAREATGMDCTPHSFRHSWISLLRAELQRAGIDDADLADVAGHTLETMRAHYTHPLRQSFDAIRRAVG
jgi:integrase